MRLMVGLLLHPLIAELISTVIPDYRNACLASESRVNAVWTIFFSASKVLHVKAKLSTLQTRKCAHSLST